MNLPVDDVTLEAVEHALGSMLTLDDDGQPVRVGADYSLPDLLDFLAGHDASDGYEDPDGIWVCHQPTYHPNQLIGALVAEVRRLRSLIPDHPLREP